MRVTCLCVYVYVLYGGGGEGGVFNTLTLFFTCKSKHYHFLAILKNLFCIYSLYLYLILKFDLKPHPGSSEL